MTVEDYNICVDRHADGLYRFVLKNIKDEDKAKDIVQDTFEKIWMRVSELNMDKAKSYLFTTAYHTMIDYLRRDKRTTELEEHHEDLSLTHNTYNDLKNVINEALTRLTDVQRSVVMLRDYEGYSYQEIGEITGLNESQVKVYIYRARLALKEYLVKLENVL